MKNIFEPVEMKNLHLKNRLIRSATWEGIADMEQILNDTKIAALSLSRPLVREPDFPNKLQRGETEISKCVSCNACYSSPSHRCIFRR